MVFAGRYLQVIEIDFAFFAAGDARGVVNRSGVRSPHASKDLANGTAPAHRCMRLDRMLICMRRRPWSWDSFEAVAPLLAHQLRMPPRCGRNRNGLGSRSTRRKSGSPDPSLSTVGRCASSQDKQAGAIHPPTTKLWALDCAQRISTQSQPLRKTGSRLL